MRILTLIIGAFAALALWPEARAIATDIDPITYEVIRYGLWNANAEHVRVTREEEGAPREEEDAPREVTEVLVDFFSEAKELTS